MVPNEWIGETGYSLSPAVPGCPERRRDERHLTILRVGLLIVGDRRELCLIRNISAGGLMAHVYSEVAEDQPVAVELKTNQMVEGRVVWRGGANTGIEFDEPIEVSELLATPSVMDNGWRPRMPRIDVERLASVRAGAKTYWVGTRDISQGGVKIATDQEIDEGSEVVVTLQELRPIPGVVRWRREGLCGITFNQVIPFTELVGWLKSGG